MGSLLFFFKGEYVNYFLYAPLSRDVRNETTLLKAPILKSPGVDLHVID